MRQPYIIALHHRLMNGISLSDRDRKMVEFINKNSTVYSLKVAIATVLSLVKLTTMKQIEQVQLGTFVQHHDKLCTKTDQSEIYDWLNQTFIQIPGKFVFELKDEDII